MKGKILSLRLVAATLAALGISACAPQPTYTEVNGVMLGTTLHVVADTRGISERELFGAIMRLDSAAKASMSIFDEHSLLSRLNRNEVDTVDAHIAYNLRLADSISRLSDGRYDVTVKPLVDAWGFAAQQRDETPNIDSLLQFVGFEKVHLEGNRLVKEDSRMQLDFNSVAKGYTVDLLAALVERYGAENYVVDIGGEVRCRGVNRAGQGWRIGVETPFDDNMTNGDYLFRRLQLQEGALATSGNYRRYYVTAEGRKVAHTINPRTGYSALSRLLSVTVVAATCAEADALGTMLLSMGAEEALAFSEAHPELPLYLILRRADIDDATLTPESPAEELFEEYISPAMESMIMR